MDQAPHPEGNSAEVPARVRGETGAQRIRAELASQLRQRNSAHAVLALKKLGAVQELCDVLRDLPHPAPWELISALGDLRDPRALEVLARRLPECVESERRDLLQAMEKIGGQAASEVLRKLLPDLKLETALLAADLAARLQPGIQDPFLDLLLQLKKSWEGGPMPGLPAGDKLIQVLDDERETQSARRFALEQLPRTRHPETVPALVRALRNPTAGLWRPAARELLALQWRAETEVDEFLLAAHSLPDLERLEPRVLLQAAPAAIESLLQDDPRQSAPILSLLDRAGWKPRTAAEHAVRHIVREEWQEAAKLGTAALEPLSAVVWDDRDCFSDPTRQAAAESFTALMSTLTAELPTARLCFLLHRGHAIRVREEIGFEEKIVVCYLTTMRQGIVRELARRGESWAKDLVGKIERGEWVNL